MEGEVTVKIKIKKPSKSVVIRPLSLGIRPAISEDIINFKLKQPCNISVEPYGIENALHIFANPIEQNVPKKGDPKVHYFGPGVHHINPITLKNGDTVYVAGGAVVYAKTQVLNGDEKNWEFAGIKYKIVKPLIYVSNQKNIKVIGRGIICGRKTLEAKQKHMLLTFGQCENVVIQGVILREASAWNVTLGNSQKVHVDNVKIIGHFVSSDGINVCGSKDVLVENSFIHNGDDSFCIKAGTPVKNVTFRNCIAWNDVATSFGIVCEVSKEVSKVIFKNCTVIHSTGTNVKGEWNVVRGVIGIWNAEGGNVHDILFEDIVIKDASETKDPMKLNVTGDKLGTIDNIVFRNVKVLDSRNNKIGLYGPKETIKNISFENIEINGKKIVSVEDENFVIKGASQVSIKK